MLENSAFPVGSIAGMFGFRQHAERLFLSPTTGEPVNDEGPQ